MFPWLIAGASPFSTAEEFAGALDGPTGGAIYTFADRPALIGIMVVLAAFIFVYFIYVSFHTKYEGHEPKSPHVLAALLLAGAATAMASVYENVSSQETRRASSRHERYEVAQSNRTSRALPAALLGMTGLAGTSKRKRARRKVRRR